MAKWRKQRGFFSIRCIVFFSNRRTSTLWIKQFVEIWWWPYLFNDTSDFHHIICSLILEAQTCHVIYSCKALMRKKSIEGFVVLFVHSNITIIDDIIWKTALLKNSLKQSSGFQEEKRNHSTLCSTILFLTMLTTNRTLRDLQLSKRTYIIHDYY